MNTEKVAIDMDEVFNNKYKSLDNSTNVSKQFLSYLSFKENKGLRNN